MQPSQKRLKQKIIEVYVENPLINPEDISIQLGANESWVNTIIDIYKSEISLRYSLYFTKSLDLLNVYYLFTDFGEKIIRTEGTIIQNIEDFTPYELTWLYLNVGLK